MTPLRDTTKLSCRSGTARSLRSSTSAIWSTRREGGPTGGSSRRLLAPTMAASPAATSAPTASGSPLTSGSPSRVEPLADHHLAEDAFGMLGEVPVHGCRRGPVDSSMTSVSTTRSHPVIPRGGASGARRRSTSRSSTAEVPATACMASVGSRRAPIRSLVDPRYTFGGNAVEASVAAGSGSAGLWGSTTLKRPGIQMCSIRSRTVAASAMRRM